MFSYRINAHEYDQHQYSLHASFYLTITIEHIQHQHSMHTFLKATDMHLFNNDAK